MDIGSLHIFYNIRKDRGLPTVGKLNLIFLTPEFTHTAACKLWPSSTDAVFFRSPLPPPASSFLLHFHEFHSFSLAPNLYRPSCFIDDVIDEAAPTVVR